MPKTESKQITNHSLNFAIEGGRKLHGKVEVKKSKNAAVALLCASLLNTKTTTLKNVPKIEEVFRLIEVLISIGVDVKWVGKDVIINPKNLNLKSINRQSAEKTRSIIMMIGPLIHKFKKFSLPHAGGCKMGSRIVSPHFYALENLGVSIKTESTDYKISATKLKPSEIILYEMGDTVTENALMAASKIDGVTKIKFASSNYMVADLCHFLMALGVSIEGVGTSTLTIRGKSEIAEDIVFDMSEDPIEAMFFISTAIITESNITIKKCPIDYLELELLKLKMMGFKYKASKIYKGENGFVNLVDITTFPSKLHSLPEKIHALPYPGINIDNLPFFAVIATQAEGETLIHDWVFEGRAIYYTELEKLGAEVLLADPHRVYIKGKTKLKAATIITPPALRPAAIIMIAMLGAKGRSLLENVYSINRGYEDLATRLNKLGAKIEVC